MKVFLDTNVLVSAFAARGLCADVLRAILAEHDLILGDTVLSELTRILHHKLGVPPGTVQETEAFLRNEATVVKDAPPVPIEIRDADDEKVLSEAVAGDAGVLVTGDKDLLDIAAESPILILSPRDFWERLRSNPKGHL